MLPVEHYGSAVPVLDKHADERHAYDDVIGVVILKTQHRNIHEHSHHLQCNERNQTTQVKNPQYIKIFFHEDIL